MGSENRHAKAKDATKRIIDTLTWKDHINVILFNHGIAGKYADKMVPATEANRRSIKNWCDQQNWKYGGTNFRDAFEETFKVLSKSVSQKATSMCQKAIMFLTDGISSTSLDYGEIQRQATDNGAFIFSCSLGSNADKQAPKRLP